MGGSGQSIATGMHKFAGIFLHMKAFYADRLQIRVLPLLGDLHLNPPLFRNRLVVLRDLIVLR